jgi:TRAP-type uncharacterized transport system fused permease subunit
MLFFVILLGLWLGLGLPFWLSFIIAVTLGAADSD